MKLCPKIILEGTRLTHKTDNFEAAREERLKVSGKPAQYDDLKAFVDEQAAFRQLISKSALPR